MKSALRWISAALVAAGVSAAWSTHAFADVKIGVTVSATGPAASLGIPEKNTIALLPKDVDTAELAAWTSVCRVILNLHEVVTRNRGEARTASAASGRSQAAT